MNVTDSFLLLFFKIDQAIFSVWLMIAVLCLCSLSDWWPSGSGDRQICDLPVNDSVVCM